ncbi:hypothetical protein MBANPS3_002310 [Mucor bainieri]
MEDKYDYSIYTTLCTIRICPVSNAIYIHRINNRISEASSRYGPSKYLEVPLEFYYNKDGGNIIYGDLMIHQYKKHPPHEKYLHVSNFLKELHSLWQCLPKGAQEKQHEKVLHSAIITFLTRIYPSELSSKEESSTTQFAFILSSHEYTSKTFIDECFLPLLRGTPWLKQEDPSSKVIFGNSIDALGYLLDGNQLPWCGLKLQREKKYLFCNLQKVFGQDKMLFSANFVRALYDPDLIAASRRSMTALNGEILLRPKSIAPTLTVEIPISPAIQGMNNLVSFLYTQVFADGGDTMNSKEQLDDYSTDSRHESLMHSLIHSISESNFRDEWNRNIEVDQFSDERNWCYMFSDENKRKLSQITYMDILQFFDDFNMLLLESKLVQYCQEHNDEESFQSIVTFDREKTSESSYQDRLCHNSINFDFANKHGHLFYLLKTQQRISDFVKNLHRNNHIAIMSLSTWRLAEAHAYKTLKMIQLSDRVGRPIVTKSDGEIRQKTTSKQLPAIQKDKLALVDNIQPYGFYVEANISCSNEVKVSLNQVVETIAEDGKLQKSTMPIQESSYWVPNMYEFVFDALWNIINRHPINQQCKLFQGEESMDLDSYKIIRANLIDAIRSSMECKPNTVQDLEKVIYRIESNPKCTCNIMITHRLVMDMGLLPYLRCTARAIVASLKSKTVFGNYKILCLLITGEFLCKWLEQSSTYGEFIWHQLQEAISSELYNKQLRVHLMMRRSVVLEDNKFNYKPLKLEKYRQVSSKQYYLVISPYGTKNFQVYQDKGDHCIKIPITRQDDDQDLIWEIPLLAIQNKAEVKFPFQEKFYVVFGAEVDVNNFYCDIRLVSLPLTNLDNMDTALASMMNIALLSGIGPFDLADNRKARCTFPLEVKIKPSSYSSAIDLRMRMGIDASENDPFQYNHVAYSERLTLQRI